MTNLSKQLGLKNYSVHTCPNCGKSSTQNAMLSNSPGFLNITLSFVNIMKGIEVTTEVMNNPKDIPTASEPHTYEQIELIGKE